MTAAAGKGRSARGQKIAEDERAYIASLAAEGMSRNDIAKLTGRGTGTVSRIINEAGLSFDRSATAAATAARQVDLQAMRVEIQSTVHQQMKQIAENIHAGVKVVQYDRENGWQQLDLDAPTDRALLDRTRAAQALASVIATLKKLDESSVAADSAVDVFHAANVGTDALPDIPDTDPSVPA